MYSHAVIEKRKHMKSYDSFQWKNRILFIVAKLLCKINVRMYFRGCFYVLFDRNIFNLILFLW